MFWNLDVPYHILPVVIEKKVALQKCGIGSANLRNGLLRKYCTYIRASPVFLSLKQNISMWIPAVKIYLVGGDFVTATPF